MAGGYAVDRAALAEAAQGLNEVISELSGLGIDETGEVGRGFSGLALSGLQAGDPGPAGAFGGFCGRWSWGVRSLVQDGNQFARNMTSRQALGAMRQQWDGVGQTAMNTPQARSVEDLLGGG